MSCPNCESLGRCSCTWDEREAARRILARKRKEFLRKIGRPTVLDREAKGETCE